MTPTSNVRVTYERQQPSYKGAIGGLVFAALLFILIAIGGMFKPQYKEPGGLAPTNGNSWTRHQSEVQPKPTYKIGTSKVKDVSIVICDNQVQECGE